MGNMSYCRNENTAQDLADVWDNWDDDLSEYETKARARLCELILEMPDDAAAWLEQGK